MCATVIELMRQGASLVEVAAELDIHRDTLNEWKRKGGEHYKEEFAKAVDRGTQLSQAWWEKQGRVNLENREFYYTGWYMNMKNRFGWRDKTETDVNAKHTVDHQISDEPMPEDEWEKEYGVESPERASESTN